MWLINVNHQNVRQVCTSLKRLTEADLNLRKGLSSFWNFLSELLSDFKPQMLYIGPQQQSKRRQASPKQNGEYAVIISVFCLSLTGHMKWGRAGWSFSALLWHCVVFISSLWQTDVCLFIYIVTSCQQVETWAQFRSARAAHCQTHSLVAPPPPPLTPPTGSPPWWVKVRRSEETWSSSTTTFTSNRWEPLLWDTRWARPLQGYVDIYNNTLWGLLVARFVDWGL